LTAACEFAERLRDRIEAAAAAGGHSRGWRLLYSPASVLDGAEIAFVGLNPGGEVAPAGHAGLATERGSAYTDERWPHCGVDCPAGEAPLQLQVRRLFEGLGVRPETVLAGNLVPFRSPDWSGLRGKPEALRFGRGLWAEILGRARPRIVVAMGGTTRRVLGQILGAGAEHRVPLGWGRVAGTRARHPHGVLVGLPDLLRFRVLGRADSSAGLTRLLEGLA